MRLIVVATIVSLAFVGSLAPRAAEAKCGGPALGVLPVDTSEVTYYREVQWGDTVQLEGWCWSTWSAEQQKRVSMVEEVEIAARYVPTRPETPGAGAPPEAAFVVTAVDDEPGFEATFHLEDVANAPQPRTPGWIEFTAQSGEYRAWNYALVTVDGRRPPDGSYVSGQVEYLGASPSDIFVVWSPMDDSAAYAYTGIRDGGAYRTYDYLAPGDWFISVVDINETSHGADPDLRAVIGYSKELERDVTLMGRVVTVGPGQALTDVDFTLTEGPAPTDDAVRVSSAPTPAPTPTSLALAVAAAREASGSSSNAWLGPTLLGAGGGLFVAFAATTRWAVRRRRG